MEEREDVTTRVMQHCRDWDCRTQTDYRVWDDFTASARRVVKEGVVGEPGDTEREREGEMEMSVAAAA